MGIKPDILEKGEKLVDNINNETLPEIQSTLKNLNGISEKVNNNILENVQKTLEGVNRTLLQINKMLPLIISSLSLVAVAAVGTFAGVLVLLFR